MPLTIRTDYSSETTLATNSYYNLSINLRVREDSLDLEFDNTFNYSTSG